jgi:HAMP domain-containing protein
MHRNSFGGRTGIGGRIMKNRKTHGRSLILFQITALVVVVFIISGAISLVFFNRSMNNLVQKSKEKLIASEAKIICGSYKYISDMMIEKLRLSSDPLRDPVKVLASSMQAIANKTTSPLQTEVNQMFQNMIRDNLLDIKLAMFALPTTPGLNSEPVVFMSSDPSLMYKTLPKEMVNLVKVDKSENTLLRARINSTSSYMLAEDGIPALGIKSPTLVTSFDMSEPVSHMNLWFFGFKPMVKDIAAIDSYYRNEERSVNEVLGIVIGITTVALILITFFVLSYLIRTRITKPMDELEAAAELAMEGDLDVEVKITPGEEFESLKMVFNSMIRSLRNLISRATGE